MDRLPQIVTRLPRILRPQVLPPALQTAVLVDARGMEIACLIPSVSVCEVMPVLAAAYLGAHKIVLVMANAMIPDTTRMCLLQSAFAHQGGVASRVMLRIVLLAAEQMDTATRTNVNATQVGWAPNATCEPVVLMTPVMGMVYAQTTSANAPQDGVAPIVTF